MAERDPVEVLREQLGRIEGLAGLHAEHEVFKHWLAETRGLLEQTFSTKSLHYQSFLALRFREVTVKAFASVEIDKLNAQRFRRDLENAKNILQGAIKELTVDRTLFRKIQTTPRSVETTLKGEYFIGTGVKDSSVLGAIQRTLEESGLSMVSTEQANSTSDSLGERIERIKRARVGIYDLSDPKNREVCIELGAALALGKTAIVTYQQGAALPEALKPVPSIEYKDTNSLSNALKKMVK
jgi:hypothetical protein